MPPVFSQRIFYGYNFFAVYVELVNYLDEWITAYLPGHFRMMINESVSTEKVLRSENIYGNESTHHLIKKINPWHLLKMIFPENTAI